MLNLRVELERVESLLKEAKRYKDLDLAKSFLDRIEKINTCLKEITDFARKKVQ